MRKELTTLFTIFIALVFMVSSSPALAASPDKKESAKTSSSTKKKSSKTSKKSDSKKSTSKKSSDNKKGSSAKKSIFKGTVNINKATKEELMQLPGIGEVKAAEIIKARKKGKFKNADDLLQVKGVGEQTVTGIKKHLKF